MQSDSRRDQSDIWRSGRLSEELEKKTTRSIKCSICHKADHMAKYCDKKIIDKNVTEMPRTRTMRRKPMKTPRKLVPVIILGFQLSRIKKPDSTLAIDKYLLIDSGASIRDAQGNYMKVVFKKKLQLQFLNSRPCTINALSSPDSDLNILRLDELVQKRYYPKLPKSMHAGGRLLGS